MSDRDQLLHLADRARRGVLLPAEGERLADAVTAQADRLDRANKAIRFMLGWESAAHVAELEQRAERAEARLTELTAGQCTHYLGTHQQHHSQPVPGCPYPGCVTQPPDSP